MNGWIRIGIVLSVIWAIGAFLYQRNDDQNKVQYWTTLMYKTCTDSPAKQNDYKGCMDKAVANSRVFDGGIPNAAFVALAPIPVGWLSAFMIFGIWRWIRRGFVPR